MVEHDIEALLEAHAGVKVTAGWQGSPDPSNWRNIRRVCKCGDLIGQVPYPQKGRFRLGGDPFDAPHRAHVAAAIRAAMTPAPTARVAPVRAQLAARRDEESAP